MIDFELEELSRDTHWRPVLLAYLEQEQAETAQARGTPSPNGPEIKPREWIPRVADVEGVERENLSKIHGKLIALGYLKFQISSREKGMCYQVSPLGKQALEQNDSPEADSELSSGEQSEAA